MKTVDLFCGQGNGYSVSSELSELTNLYSLSKTLRFELKPEPETKQRFEKWLDELKDVNDFNEAIKNGNLFAEDNAIYKAYIALKPILDSIHEQYITIALQSDEAKEIKFTDYFEKYRSKESVEAEEKNLRNEIGKLYSIPASRFIVAKTKSKSKTKKQEVIDDEDTAEENAKDSKKKSEPYKILTDKSILSYIEQNIGIFAKDISGEELKKHLEAFKGFFTYFSGYNINRENYYTTKDEKSTAIATRIVHENLPCFCNNIIRFEENKDVYNQIYDELKKLSKELKIKTPDGEKEAEPITGEIFRIAYFNSCLSQTQIEEYNLVIGNCNFLINLYNQAHSKDGNFKKLPLFETLYKQIGCGKKKSLFLALIKDSEAELTDEQRKNDEILSLEKMLSVISEKAEMVLNGKSEKSEISTIQDYLCYLKKCSDWKGIYWNKAAVTSISNRFFMNWYDVTDKLQTIKSCATFDKKREEQFKLNDAVELDGLFSVLDLEKTENSFKQSVLEEYKEIINLNDSTSKNLIRILCSNAEKSVSYVLENKNKVLETKRTQKSFVDSEKDNAYNSMVKEWLDALIDVFHFVRMFDVRENKVKGNILNSEIKGAVNLFLHNEATPWFKWYDAVRNYLTKKPQDDVKNNMLKLNFGSSSLLGGWSDGEEINKRATLLKHGKSIYLCILKNNYIFDTSKEDNPIYKTDGDGSRLILRKLSFQTLAGKGFVSKFGIRYSDIGRENPEKAIELLKEIIRERYLKKYPDLEKIVNTNYSSKQEFDADIRTQLNECYICTFENIDWNLVVQKEKEGEIFLLKIWCRDFAEKSIGNKQNLQTLYWENILTENSSHQLSANAKIFMRKPIENIKPYSHKANSIMLCKKEVPDSIFRSVKEIIDQNPTASENELRELIEKNKISILGNINYNLSKLRFSKKDHEIIKNKRFFGENKYFFYCPIKLNYEEKTYAPRDYKKASYEVNTKVNDVIQQSEEIKYLGVDRGEKNLIYTCVVDKNGKIIDCSPQNTVNHTDYNQKLSEIAANRQQARKNWQTIENISNLKEGYLSNVIHKIVTQTIKEPTYIVLEDLNVPMMQSRQKVEKQVYQKFEVALAKKLNFVVDKNAKENQLASVGKALQLTPPISNYQDIESKKQFGVMLYTRANYTSITDPVTGWRKTVYFNKGSEKYTKNAILESFSEIAFDGKDYYFEYTEKHAGKTWRLYSGKDGKSLPRYQNNKKLENDKAIWEPESVDLVSLLNELFKDFDKTKSLRMQIENNEHSLCKISTRKETAWDSLRYVIDTIQHIRNTGKTDKDNNFLFSPVRDENGIHFDTRNHDNTDLPADADANGAYNIARKGIIMDAHIKQWKKDGEKKSDLDLFVSDEEWDLWLLDKNKWNEKLSFFASRSAKDVKSKKNKK